MILAYGEGWAQYYAGARTESFVLAGRNRRVLFSGEWGIRASAERISGSPAEYLKKNRVKELGIVREGFPLAEYQRIRRIKGVRLYDATREAWQERKIKQEKEIKKIKAAAVWTARVLEETLPEISPGVTERQASALVTGRLLEKAEALSFPSIVASGPNSVHVHWYPSDRRIRKGDLVIVDVGVVKDGYCSDVTRTILFGRDKKKESMIDACEKARHAFEDGQPKSVGEAVTLIEKALGKNQRLVRYAYGHGIGVEVHEPPVIRRGVDEPFKKGMTVAVEPGLHKRNVGGARIENDYYYNGRKWELLTK